jgi:hypothetical protein
MSDTTIPQPPAPPPTENWVVLFDGTATDTGPSAVPLLHHMGASTEDITITVNGVPVVFAAGDPIVADANLYASLKNDPRIFWTL